MGLKKRPPPRDTNRAVKKKPEEVIPTRPNTSSQYTGGSRMTGMQAMAIVARATQSMSISILMNEIGKALELKLFQGLFNSFLLGFVACMTTTAVTADVLAKIGKPLDIFMKNDVINMSSLALLGHVFFHSVRRLLGRENIAYPQMLNYRIKIGNYASIWEANFKKMPDYISETRTEILKQYADNHNAAEIETGWIFEVWQFLSDLYGEKEYIYDEEEIPYRDKDYENDEEPSSEKYVVDRVGDQAVRDKIELEKLRAEAANLRAAATVGRTTRATESMAVVAEDSKTENIVNDTKVDG